ncbi:uncharacterized protein LOC115442933 [Manduca sexta]|uniref:uncharacterized protein LOC115442933 n=1 Tax=Manduca sexta TaxID=7130 RepID=UPI00188EFE52|nr:uncharacterized protein LOC115442933 [Manduca sexta]
MLDGNILDAKVQTAYILNITVERYEDLIPNIRNKRGILNPLGTVLKVITGNLDNEDAIRYDTLIKSIQSKQNAINKRITVVSEIVDTLVDLTNSTRNNFIVLGKTIDEMELLLNRTHFQRIKELVINTYNLLTHNFQILLSRLEEVETIIAFSRLNVLHQFLFNYNELFNILKDIEKVDNLILPVTYRNLINIEKHINIKAFVKNKQITFILSVPTIQLEMYSYYQLHPFPMFNPNINETLLINPKYSFILVKELKILALMKPCKEIIEDKFMCQENDISPTNEDNCIMDLMKFAADITSCSPIKVTAKNIKLKSITNNKWIVYTANHIFMKEYCENDMNQYDLFGTYTLILNEDCRIQLGNITLRKRHYQGQPAEIKRMPVVNLPEITAHPKFQKTPINLDDVDIENLQLMSKILKDNKVDSDEEQLIVNTKSVSIGTIIIYVILLCILVILVIRYKNKIVSNIRKRCNQNHHLRTSDDDFELKEGRVKCPTTLYPTVVTTLNNGS